MFRFLLIVCLTCSFCAASAQKTKDTTDLGSLNMADLDVLFSELDAFLDSITKPRSFASVALSGSNRLINTQTASGSLQNEQVLMLAPSVGYFHKSGFGLGASTSLFWRERAIKPVQYLGTLSYDYLRNPKLMTGVAFTHFIAADSLDFYTSPFQNEVSGYFAYRQSWLKPVLSVSYGWGSFTNVEEQQTIIKQLRKKTITVGPPTTVTTTEKVSDISVALAVRHDFYWLKVLAPGDHIRFSPQLSLSGGTQKYGLNQTSQTMAFRGNSHILKPFTSENVALEETSKFRPLSVTGFLRGAYAKGKFYVQPQLILDYYLPATDNPFTASFLVSTGFMF